MREQPPLLFGRITKQATLEGLSFSVWFPIGFPIGFFIHLVLYLFVGHIYLLAINIYPISHIFNYPSMYLYYIGLLVCSCAQRARRIAVPGIRKIATRQPPTL